MAQLTLNFMHDKQTKKRSVKKRNQGHQDLSPYNQTVT